MLNELICINFNVLPVLKYHKLLFQKNPDFVPFQ